MRRGEVWWASLSPPAGRRPVVLLSRDSSYEIRELVMVAPITSRIRRIASEVPLGEMEGMPWACVINVDTITTVSKACLESKLTTLSPGKIRELNAAVRFALGF